MEYCLKFYDAQGRWAVITDAKEGLIGHNYKFKPMKAHIVKTAYDAADFYYSNETKEPIPVGEEVTIDTWWMNFYGSYFKIMWQGHNYDVKTDCVLIDKED